MKRSLICVTTYLMLAFISPGFAQNAPAAKQPAAKHKPSVQAKPKQSAECMPVGAVRGVKLWAGNCATAAPTAPSAAEPEPTSQEATPGGKQ
jgi:hypothetical protein